MKLWTPHHAALLDALRAERLIPKLYQRLSRERYEVDDAEWRRLSDWPATLHKEAGWALIAPVLDQPSAWPDVWHRAGEKGWSDQAQHHHALLFSRLTERFLDDEEFDLATWSWMESWRAWKQIFGSDYMSALMQDILPDSPSEEEEDTEHDAEEVKASRQAILTGLLDPMIARRAHALRVCLCLDDVARKTEAFDRRRLRFGWSALLLLGELLREVEPGSDPHGTLARVRARAATCREQVAAEAVARFERMVDALDLANAPSSEVLRPFEWIAEVFQIITHTEYAVTTVVTRAVELCWRMRKMGREERTDDLPRVLQLTEPFNQDLYRRLEAKTSFGHNSKCADFIVFQGEDLSAHEERLEIFARAVNISPGHRNSSMLLSHEHLRAAGYALDAVALVPAPMRHIPGNTRHTEQIEAAAKAVEKARALYPPNEKLPAIEERLESAASKYDVDISRWRRAESESKEEDA